MKEYILCFSCAVIHPQLTQVWVEFTGKSEVQILSWVDLKIRDFVVMTELVLFRFKSLNVAFLNLKPWIT